MGIGMKMIVRLDTSLVFVHYVEIYIVAIAKHVRH